MSLAVSKLYRGQDIFASGPLDLCSRLHYPMSGLVLQIFVTFEHHLSEVKLGITSIPLYASAASINFAPFTPAVNARGSACFDSKHGFLHV